MLDREADGGFCVYHGNQYGVMIQAFQHHTLFLLLLIKMMFHKCIHFCVDSMFYPIKKYAVLESFAFVFVYVFV